MDKVLAEQPRDTWDSFPLFKILNDYLREDDNLKNGRFHQHLRDTFSPMVVRYVDLMETSIAQSIYKGFEKERWEIKGNGCATSGELFWKLDALQSFIRDLHWPDQEFRQHLEQRLTLMACDMIETCIQRTDAAFQQWLKKGVTFISTDYIIPSEMCAMVNVNTRREKSKFRTVHHRWRRRAPISRENRRFDREDFGCHDPRNDQQTGHRTRDDFIQIVPLRRGILHRLHSQFDGIGKWERNGTGLRKLHEELHGPDSWQSFGRIVDFNVLRAMVHGANSNAVHVALGEARP